MGLAAVIGGSAMAVQIAKRSCHHLAAAAAPSDKMPPDVRQWALALGATHRAAGGIVLRSCLAEALTALMALAKHEAHAKLYAGASAFALHGLCLVVSSAVDAARWAELVLDAALECLLRPVAAEAGLQPAAAAVVTAIVEAQGPAFGPSSKTHPVAEYAAAIVLDVACAFAWCSMACCLVFCCTHITAIVICVAHSPKCC